LPACSSNDSNLSPEGHGFPIVTVAFPPSVDPGSVHTAVVTVTNPGPGDMPSVVVAFSRVGLDNPIVDGGAHSKNPNVLAVSPKPAAVDPSAVVYTFGPLRVKDSQTFDFKLRVPAQPGEAGNAVTAYDGSEVERVRGAHLSTTVR
jgi:hypothetical protein